MAPGSESMLWRAYMSAEYLALDHGLRRLLERLERADVNWRTSRAGRRVIGWLTTLSAALAAKLGRPRASLGLLGRAVKLVPHELDAELVAWMWNVRAIAVGKLDRHAEHEHAIARGVEAARACGDEWLARTIKLRAVHKSDWAAAGAQRGGPDDAVTQLIRSVALPRSPDLAELELRHLAAQADAYLALHFTWDERTWEQADSAIRSAQSLFAELGDVAELARLESERGRLALVSERSAADAASDLRAGLARRVRSGELSRARYDLLYLSGALRVQGRMLEAELCLWSGIAIHAELYGTEAVDPGSSLRF